MEQVVVQEARAALERADFAAAMDLLEVELPPDTDATEWFSMRAQAAFGAGDYDVAVECWEELHRRHRSSGDSLGAAYAAVMTAMFLLIESGMMSTVRGWVRRAERLLDGHEIGETHALVAAVRCYERFFSGDLDAALEHASRAVELGERLHVTPAVAMGRTATARISVLDGDPDRGLDQLDEVAALLMSGDVDPLTTGMMYCEIICAAQGLARHDLAREWTEAMERWCPDRAFGCLRGRCRVHRAELLRLSGPASEAEREALQACGELRPWMRREFGWPMAELGTIRLRRGDLAGAEEAFLAAGDHEWPQHPGLALVRMEQGDAAMAAELIAAAIAHPSDAPSKEQPPFGDLRLAPLLDAQAEISMAVGDGTTLAAAADALARIAARYASPALIASADLAAARASLVAGDAEGAAARARAAVVGYLDLDAVFDAARARTVAADALELLGDQAGAVAERAAAHRAFDAYGAVLRAAALAERMGRSPLPRPSSSAAARRGSITADGSHWQIELAGERGAVKDLKGIRYLRRLVANPGREFHVLDLVAVENGTLRVASDADHAAVRRGDAALPVLDDAAREAYRRRLAEVDDDIDDAIRNNDLDRQTKAEADRSYVIAELRHAVGLGGRDRATGGSAERARTSVARTLRYALAEISLANPSAAEHFRSSLRTGMYCSYQPERFARIEWDV